MSLLVEAATLEVAQATRLNEATRERERKEAGNTLLTQGSEGRKHKTTRLSSLPESPLLFSLLLCLVVLLFSR